MKKGQLHVNQIKYLDNTIQNTAEISPKLSIKDVNGDYSIVAEDLSNKLIRVNSPLGVLSTVLFPSNSTISCPVGTKVLISSNGFGPITIAAEAGVNVFSSQSLTIDRKYGRVTIIKTGVDDWEIAGQVLEQVKFEFLPINPAWSFQYLDRVSFNDLDDETIIATVIYFNNGNQVSILQTPLISNLYYNNIENFSLSNQFATTFPDKVYFRATVQTPGVSLVEELSPNINYYSENSWTQFRIPSANNNYIENQTNPRYKILQSRLDEVPVTVKIELSENPDIFGFIGSFEINIDTLQAAHFIENFSFISQNLASNHFIVNSSTGALNFFDLSDTITEVSYFRTRPDISINILAGTYFRVALLSGSNLNEGSGMLGEIYNSDAINSVTWPSSSTSPVTYLIEILSDITGSLEVFCSGEITLATTGQIGDSFSNPLTVSLNSTTPIEFTPQFTAIYVKIIGTANGILHLFTTGTVDTIGTFYDETETELDFNNDTVDINFELFENISTGIYYLKVEPFNGQPGTTQLTVEFIPM